MQGMKRMNEMCKLGTIKESWCINLGRKREISVSSAMQSIQGIGGTGASVMQGHWQSLGKEIKAEAGAGRAWFGAEMHVLK